MKGIYDAAKARQNVEAASECISVAEAALAAGDRERAVSV